MISGNVVRISDRIREFVTSIGTLRVEKCHDGKWYCTVMNLKLERKLALEDLNQPVALIQMVGAEIVARTKADTHAWERGGEAKNLWCTKCGICGGNGEDAVVDAECPGVKAPCDFCPPELGGAIADGTRINTAEEAGQEGAEKVVRMRLSGAGESEIRAEGAEVPGAGSTGESQQEAETRVSSGQEVQNNAESG